MSIHVKNIKQTTNNYATITFYFNSSSQPKVISDYCTLRSKNIDISISKDGIILINENSKNSYTVSLHITGATSEKLSCDSSSYSPSTDINTKGLYKQIRWQSNSYAGAMSTIKNTILYVSDVKGQSQLNFSLANYGQWHKKSVAGYIHIIQQ